MEDLSLVGLRIVCEVARRGSFSAAGEALGYTQSAISRQVAHAERTSGRRLFDRHARGARPTAAGEILVRRATAALAELQAGRLELEDLTRRPPRRVRLGAFSTAMAALVPEALVALAATEPGLSVLLREGTTARLLDRVASGRIELAVVTVPPAPPEGLEVTVLGEDPLLVALPRSHPLAGRTRIDPELLRDGPWIAGSSDPGSTLLGAWSADARPAVVAYEVRDWTAKIGLVARGLGITMVPGLSAPTLPPTVAVAALDHAGATRTIGAVTRTGVEGRDVLGVLDALTDAAARLTGERRRASGRF